MGMHGIGMSILILLYLYVVLVLGGGLAMAIGGDRDTLSKGESLARSQTLTSKNGFFELGFFPPNPSISNTNKFYLSIRYIEFQDQKTIVWVANREKPLTGTTGSRLEISASGGNLQLYDGSDSIWSAGGDSSPESVMVAVLSDEGNLILRDERLGLVVWQSFDNPTDTWLPGAKLGMGRRLVSWRSDDDPSPGIFSAEVPESNAWIVLKWKDEEGYGQLQMDNNDKIPSQLSFSSENIGAKVGRQLENRVSLFNDTGGGVFSMVVMEHREGVLTAVTSWRGGGQRAPERLRLTTGTLCGANGVRYMTMTTSSSSSSSSKLCGCLPGYTALSNSLMGWNCSREDYAVDCEKKKNENFEEVSIFKLPDGGYNASSEEDCEAQCLSKCSCKAYAFDDRARCVTWDEDLVGTQEEEDISSNRQKLYVRLATEPKPKGETKLMEVIIAVVVPVLVIAFGAFLGFFYNRRTKHKHKAEMEVGEDLLSFDFKSSNEGTISRTGSFTNTNTNTNREFDLPMFTYASVSAATNNFSPENKLGEGGFGPVYKGCLLNGQEIALKRLSQKSGQGFEEFRNEMLLIAKLQHRNLVRLLGCCIHPNESILIYEYLPNKSLDLFLFAGSKKLDWMMRTRIIEGVAQGILYLHEYSRVRIIHRDLKASNILLDDEMNPKISDFGMARIFAGNDSQAHTNKIVGTYGYIAPEYAMEGLFSIKSDVFSFGVLVLEIISGRKNTSFYKTDSLNLLGHAWDLWISGRGEELVEDKAAGGSRALRYINVGLLCVQENPNERPNMSSVVSMLSSEIEALPQPKKPAFSASTLITTSSSSVTKSEGGGGGGDLYPSINGITVSDIVPR